MVEAIPAGLMLAVVVLLLTVVRVPMTGQWRESAAVPRRQTVQHSACLVMAVVSSKLALARYRQALVRS